VAKPMHKPMVKILWSYLWLDY